ncbi:type VI secretion system tip protein TssI/VgrG [Candidatus Curculioniphilus buchneri]|uniref:type VI secretion system Vgr family protein n=1 Tax=Candidatus Curculioniphilus buchneri TaxID=690594 RepID=UPI00376F02FE
MNNRDIHRITINGKIESDLIFLQLVGEENLSTLYQFTIECLSTRDDKDLETLAGLDISLEIPLKTGTHRYLHGYITQAEYSGNNPWKTQYYQYRFLVKPALWYLTLNKDCRTWQGLTAPDIVIALLNKHHIQYENNLTHSYHPYEYCVQYQESTFSFISRLIEHEGIYYFFKHMAHGHIMVLSDAPETHQAISGYEKIHFQKSRFGLIDSDEGVQNWSVSHTVTSNLCILDDYDFRRPRACLLEACTHPTEPIARNAEIFDWPSGYNNNVHGQFLARIRQETLASNQHKINGLSTSRGMSPGHIFSLINGPSISKKQNFLVIGMRYFINNLLYLDPNNINGLLENNTRAGFSAKFKATFANRAWRPIRITPKPKILGPQTAEVTGPKGKNIWTDKYGRVKLKFRWDRHGSSGNDTGSCWVRVSTNWAGWKYGSIQVPRIGEEVIVDFINGDPDRPIVIGRVYNENALPPWELPAHATRMGIMSCSQSNLENSNYLFLEDSKGYETLSIHAAKDMVVAVENNFQSIINGNFMKKIVGRSDYTYLGPCSTQKFYLDHQTLKKGKISIVNGGRVDIINGGIHQNVTGSIEYITDENLELCAVKSLIQNAKHNLIFNAGKRIIYGDGICYTKELQSQHINSALQQYQLEKNSDCYNLLTFNQFRPTRVLYTHGKHTKINGNDILYVKHNQKQHIDGNFNQKIKGKSDEYCSGHRTIQSNSDTDLKTGGKMQLCAHSLRCNVQGTAEVHASTNVIIAGTTENIDGVNIAISQTAIHTRNMMMSSYMIDMANIGLRLETVGVNIKSGQLDIHTSLLSLHTSALTIFI